MNYRDLIDFEPVDSVVQLRWADDHSRAASLVSSYVISDRMGDMILGQILPVIDLRPSQRNGGLFVVGNYGTGKSHLMSVISAVAEHSELAASLTHAGVAAGLAPLAGRFQVVRQEFGATQMPLRDVVFGYLEDGLAQMGVAYRFPPMDQVRNSKDSLVLMMARFQEKYPDQGLLVMIDELLEYLTHRNDKQLALDLAFLREMGEVSSQTALRFVAGLQEALFDNPRFQFAADSVRRVKDRFEQVRIVREDVAYVVSRRLLRKNDQQRAWIRRHLEGFTDLYGDMAERLDVFIELFPIHPAYLETFEQVTLIEKRQALREISREMQQRLDQPVSSEEPGLLSFDSYWRAIQSDASYRAVPLSAAEFYQGLSERFLERDGMVFHPLHAAEYDKRRLQAERIEQLALFLNDERSAIQWLQRELDPATGNGPQSYQDVQPRFLRELHQARHEAMPELREILEENFLQDEAERWYVPDPERQEDLDKLREKGLLREFSAYLGARGRLRTFRGEAVRAGFSHAWRQRDYATILKVADRLPSNVLEEDANLLMYVDNARLRHQEIPVQPGLLE